MMTKNKRIELILSYIPTNKTICEIGVWKGELTKHILKTKPKTYYLIDPYKYLPEYNKRRYGGKLRDGQDGMDKLFNKIKKKFPKCNLIRKESGKVDMNSLEMIDILYIDGNHDSQFVFDDLKNYSEKLVDYGLIICDDYDTKHEGIKKAVLQFINENRRYKIINTAHNQCILLKVLEE